MLARVTLGLILIAASAAESKSDTLFSDRKIRVGYFTDTNSISQTLIGGLLSEDRMAVLTITCDATGSLLGGVMRRADHASSNSVRLTFDDGKSLSFRGREYEVSGVMQFDTAASKGSMFISDVDSVRMKTPSNMRFIKAAYKSDPLIVSFPNGNNSQEYQFVMLAFKPWMQRIALECEKSLEND